MNIQEQLRKEFDLLQASGHVLPVEFNWLTVDKMGRVEAWKVKPTPHKLFEMWVSHEVSVCIFVRMLNGLEKRFKLLTSQWKSCIIAINETQQKPSNDAPLTGLVAIAAMLNNHPDCWL